MTPDTSSPNLWDIAVGAILTVFGWMFRQLWRDTVRRAELDTAIAEALVQHRIEDLEADKLLLAPLERDAHNLRDMLVRIDNKLDRLIEKLGDRERGH